ncbi:ribonuclease P protein component [Pseudoclavibacter sp. VKM Ac-2867]|uniref:ribonuclease P protein component n=1 Tax=Pseudoclavibacter sp. VKM Ac-2867 TaxID=2783829 RepID=UPI00188C2D80|nr:ribonuclease P protein component [Pseudoclavibacter sp. VKM Ac-2867]MBF4458371.1 ribonuclease P protein component [Pseudoclavibacter sp. VKM Ac-2867]
MLPYANRVTKGDDYQAIVRRGVRVGARGITVSVRERDTNDTPTRFGFIVSKRVGVAVVRNRIRRRLKAVSRELLPEVGLGFDIVYRVHPEAAALGFEELRERARFGSLRGVRRIAANGEANAPRTVSSST